MLTFPRVRCHGAAGGMSRTGTITATIEATNCDTVASVEAMVSAAPEVAAALADLLAKAKPHLIDTDGDEGRDLADAIADARAALAKAGYA